MDYLAPLGPVYQAGTLSGNPLAMAAGIAALKKLKEVNPYPRLEKFGRQIQAALLDGAKARGLPLQVPQTGSMFCLFFSPSTVNEFSTRPWPVKQKHFKAIFRHALNRGVYLPPSPFETCFICSAHEGKAIDRACEILSHSLKEL